MAHLRECAALLDKARELIEHLYATRRLPPPPPPPPSAPAAKRKPPHHHR